MRNDSSDYTGHHGWGFRNTVVALISYCSPEAVLALHGGKTIWDVSEKDESGNATSGNVILLHTANSFVRADENLVTLVGHDDVGVSCV